MDYVKAFEILELDISKITTKDITLSKLKKKYHKLALQNHPDKNGNTNESNEKFRKIHEAYEYLKTELQLEESSNHANTSTGTTTNTETTFDNAKYTENMPQYLEILQLFMKTMMEGKYNSIISKIVQDIVSGCTKITQKLLEDLDKDTCMQIYTFLSNHRSILHLNDTILENIREIVQQKFENVFVYKLNPSLQDLINNNIYKLNIQEQICYVPLWIHESCFDISGCEIITICEPELPPNIIIDEDNNLYVNCEISIDLELKELIINNSNYVLQIANKFFNVPLEKLCIKQQQKYIIKNAGLCKNNSYDLGKDNLDSLEKADIIVTIKLI